MLLVVTHIAGALAGLALGMRAVRAPLGSRAHRRAGYGYLAAWVTLASTGFALGADDTSISAFEALTAVGLGFVALAFGAVRFRRRLGARWLRAHVRWMTASYASLAVATVNQLLLQTVGDYPRWLFWGLVLSPFLVLPRWNRRLEARPGLARAG
jgi:hypothetical protein